MVEMPGTINWMEPADIDIEDAVSGISTADAKGVFPHRVGTHFAPSDTTVRVISRDATEATIRKTLTKRGDK